MILSSKSNLGDTESPRMTPKRTDLAAMTVDGLVYRPDQSGTEIHHCPRFSSADQVTCLKKRRLS
jgi:hypothetical protein